MATFGVMMFATDYAIQPVELARATEERGLDSLFFPEHTHIPTSRKSPWPGGAELPMEYSHTHDLFVALTAAAAVTKRIKLGTGICLVIERDPILMAKEVASLDVISGGRVVLGIGVAGTPKRWKITAPISSADGGATRTRSRDEGKSVDDKAEFHGEFVDCDPIWSWPNR